MTYVEAITRNLNILVNLIHFECHLFMEFYFSSLNTNPFYAQLIKCQDSLGFRYLISTALTFDVKKTNLM